MVQAAVTEQLLVTTVCRKRFIVELLPVDELGLVDEDMVEREGVGGSAAVLRDDIEIGTVVESNRVLPVHWLEVRILPMQRLPRLFAHDVVNITLVAPLLEVDQS